MKKIRNDRSLLKFIVFGILTFGIYELWYFHKIAKDVNIMCADYGKKTSGIVAYIFLTLLTCGLYAIFWWFRLADIISGTIRKRGLNSSISTSTVMICFIFNYFCGLLRYVAFYQIFDGVNVLADDYNARMATEAAMNKENTEE